LASAGIASVRSVSSPTGFTSFLFMVAPRFPLGREVAAPASAHKEKKKRPVFSNFPAKGESTSHRPESVREPDESPLQGVDSSCGG
jgi:hypothetical protein